MRNLFISFNILCLFLVACSTTSSLPTDTDEIDISGRWNATDSEIATAELMKQLANSSWYATVKRENSNSINFNVKPLVGAEGQEVSAGYESIQEALEDYVDRQKDWENITESSNNLAVDFYLVPSISKSERKAKNETVYLYTLQLEVFSNSEELVYRNQEAIKKYIKN